MMMQGYKPPTATPTAQRLNRPNRPVLRPQRRLEKRARRIHDVVPAAPPSSGSCAANRCAPAHRSAAAPPPPQAHQPGEYTSIFEISRNCPSTTANSSPGGSARRLCLPCGSRRLLRLQQCRKCRHTRRRLHRRRRKWHTPKSRCRDLRSTSPRRLLLMPWLPPPDAAHGHAPRWDLRNRRYSGCWSSVLGGLFLIAVLLIVFFALKH